jgi:hypothetical protein
MSNVDKDLDAVVSILNDFAMPDVLHALMRLLEFLNAFTGVHDTGMEKYGCSGWRNALYVQLQLQ